MSNYVEILDDDGQPLGQLPVSKEGGRLRRVTRFTTPGQHAYEKPAWLKFIKIRGVAGGGAAGGAASTVSGQNSIGGGGQAGGYGDKLISAEDLSASETVTVGAGGTPGAPGANVGGDGSVSSFGTHLTLTGGKGGNGGAAFTNTASSATGGGTTGGQAVGGDNDIPGEPGGRASVISGYIATTGYGAASKMSATSPYTQNANGNTGNGPGGGGSGPYNGVSQSARSGGPGADGLWEVEEFE